MNKIILLLFVYLPLINFAQSIDSNIINHFNIKKYVIINYFSETNWEIKFTDNFNHLLKRRNDKLSDSITYIGVLKGGYDLYKFRINENGVINKDTIIGYSVTKNGKLRITLFTIYTSSNIPIRRIQYFDSTSHYDNMEDYKIREENYDSSLDIWNISYFDYKNNLRVKGQYSSKTRGFGFGEWQFFDKEGKLEATGFFSDSILTKNTQLMDTLKLDMIFRNSFYFEVNTHNLHLDNSRLICSITYYGHHSFIINSYGPNKVNIICKGQILSR